MHDLQARPKEYQCHLRAAQCGHSLQVAWVSAVRDIPDFDDFFVNGCCQSLAAHAFVKRCIEKRRSYSEENQGIGPLDSGCSYCIDEPFHCV